MLAAQVKLGLSVENSCQSVQSIDRVVIGRVIHKKLQIALDEIIVRLKLILAQVFSSTEQRLDARGIELVHNVMGRLRVESADLSPGEKDEFRPSTASGEESHSPSLFNFIQCSGWVVLWQTNR